MLESARAAVAAGDGRAVERAAHALKGSLGELCAGGAQALARELEAAGREARLGDAGATFGALDAAVGELLADFEAIGGGDA